MSASAALLRVLLSLVLILNGIGGAVASTRMQFEHAGRMHGATHADAAGQASGLPCHEQHAGVGLPDGSADPAAAAETPAGTTHSPDCCESGTCRCPCAHQIQVALQVAFFPESVIVHSTSVRAMKPAHAAPALPHLIRPPIG